MKICLIIPPSPFLLDERVFMHIGILKVASSLESKGYTVDMLDLSGVENYLEVVRSYTCKKNAANVFGLTASTPQIPFSVSIAKTLRSISDKYKLIIGGPHVTLMNTACKRETKKGLHLSSRATEDIANLSKIFDILVCGDGELTIFEALKVDSGIIDADDKKSKYFLSNKQFSNLPFPARHLVDVDSYKYSIENKKSVSLIAQLGCPFKCSFCSGRNSPFLRKIRQRSSDSIINEMRHLYHTYNYTGFMFYDDELNVNKGLVELLNKITDLQDEVGEEFRLRGFVKAELSKYPLSLIKTKFVKKVAALKP